ncbi:unnamed protein product [Gongylonema pulchrum]|uniref:Secreted protein n=1 Tax=Gongylonema pulchrum TaxID=637853 RepID=A0A183DLZ2_9BILA|nr:unnamed protein product [Gongylonema pulchrum]
MVLHVRQTMKMVAASTSVLTLPTATIAIVGMDSSRIQKTHTIASISMNVLVTILAPRYSAVFLLQHFTLLNSCLNTKGSYLCRCLDDFENNVVVGAMTGKDCRAKVFTSSPHFLILFLHFCNAEVDLLKVR